MQKDYRLGFDEFPRLQPIEVDAAGDIGIPSHLMVAGLTMPVDECRDKLTQCGVNQPPVVELLLI